MEHSRLTIWSLFFLVASCGSVFAQRKPVLPPPVDSLITVCHRKYENDLRIGGENHGDTDE